MPLLPRTYQNLTSAFVAHWMLLRAMVSRGPNDLFLAGDTHQRIYDNYVSLGSLGIDAFTPIIHLPQCAVLGIGRIVREPVVAGDRIVPGTTLTLSLTFDHRIVDGREAVSFLKRIKEVIESPSRMLIEI